MVTHVSLMEHSLRRCSVAGELIIFCEMDLRLLCFAHKVQLHECASRKIIERGKKELLAFVSVYSILLSSILLIVHQCVIIDLNYVHIYHVYPTQTIA